MQRRAHRLFVHCQVKRHCRGRTSTQRVSKESEFVSPLEPELLQERRGRDVGLAVDPVDEERHLVDVAPVPVFAWLE